MGGGYEKLYERFEPFLKSVAAKTYRKNGWKVQSYEDLYQSVVYLFLYALKIYNPEKGELEPHVKRVVNLKLKSMLAGERAPWSGEYPFTFLRCEVREAGLD